MAPQIGGSAADGTYNPKLGAFLLPPLVGLPYSDMVANGMFPPFVSISTRLKSLLQGWEQNMQRQAIQNTPSSS